MEENNIPGWIKKKKIVDELRLKNEDFPENLRVMTEEESRKFEQERLEKRITPELLTKFSRYETERLVKYFDGCPSEQTFGKYHTYDLGKLSKEAIDFLKEEIKGKKIIELGSSGSDQAKLWFECKFKAKAYGFADPAYNIDGLSYLMRQPDESAIVTSFGVLEEGVLYNVLPELKEYTKLLGNEIYRVTPKGAITFHGLEYDGDLINAGFKEPENIPEDFNKELGSWSFLRILRKK